MNAGSVAGAGIGQRVIVPSETSELFPIGSQMDFLREQFASITFLVGADTVKINSRHALRRINYQYGVVILKKTAIDEWILMGDL